MNAKQLFVLALLATWLGFAFLYAAREVQEPGLWDRTKAQVKLDEPPEPAVTYDFVWSRDSGEFLLLALPAVLFGAPLVLLLGRKKS